MKNRILIYSKSKIDRAGEVLKKPIISKAERDEALEILSNWRAFHAEPLNTFARILKTRVKKRFGDKNTIVAQRLKRTPSILLKLQNHKTMRLSAMQDIGGLRAILESTKDVNSLVHLYRASKSKHKLAVLHDYVAKPKLNGYRSVHLVYQLEQSPSIFIEIQIRSYLQHIWATAVEVFGTLKNSSFKSGHGDKKWLDLFAHLSSVFALKEGTPVLDAHNELTGKQILNRIKNMITELKAIEQLHVYTSVYRITSSETKKNNRSGGYSLVVLDSKENTISFQTFSVGEIDTATSRYMEMEKKFYDDPSMNVVLVNTGDVKKLEVSYPNYFMDTKVLVRYLSEIMINEFKL